MGHLNSGETLQNGRYTINEILGVGGFGITYLATDERTREKVAIKSLNANLQIQPDFTTLQAKFIQEAFRLAKCHHPHIVKAYDIFEENNLWYMVMEYINGQSLDQYLQEKGKLSEEEALKIIQQVGEGLIYVHSQGFLHRDVKPQNILLRPYSLEAVLIDFGLAREFIKGEPKTHTPDGTHGFTPIEQYKEKGKRGEFTDVYALTATLYNLLTGEIPIPAIFREKSYSLNNPKDYNSEISDKINNAILSGMELSSKNRPQTIEEWLSLLIDEDDLSSDKGIDYRKLRDLLNAGKWKEADHETHLIMLKIIGEDDGAAIDWKGGDFPRFSCTDLRTIDRLWVKYSNSHFGFSIQKQIYQSIITTLDNGRNKLHRNSHELSDQFFEKIGWDKYYSTNFCFNLLAPKGHLPVALGYSYELASCHDDDPYISLILEGYNYIFERMEICEYLVLDYANDSERGLNELEHLLKNGNWLEAYEETIRLIFEEVSTGWNNIDLEDFEEFEEFESYLANVSSRERNELENIDRLWLRYGKGKSGLPLVSLIIAIAKFV